MYVADKQIGVQLGVRVSCQQNADIQNFHYEFILIGVNACFLHVII